MKKKKILAILSICVLTLSACGSKENSVDDSTQITETQAEDVTEEAGNSGEDESKIENEGLDMCM